MKTERPTKMYFYTLLGILILVLQSCSVSKHLPAESKIYGGSKLTFEKPQLPEGLSKADLETQLKEILIPKENSKIGKYPYKVANYYLFKADKKKRRGLVSRIIERPVFYQSNFTEKNTLNLQSYLQTRGFFDAKVRF
jgi:hypothetical protein